MGPILVVVAALVAAVAIALLGVGQLAVTSDAAAAERAEVLAATLGARLRATPQEGSNEVLDRAARRSAAELLLVDQAGQIVVNESFGSPTAEEVVKMLAKGSGEKIGRAHV